MTNEITNGMLLEHMQSMKQDLQGQITSLATEMMHFRKETARNFEGVRQEFEEARQHREALQEDLFATMRVVAKHEKKLSRSS